MLSWKTPHGSGRDSAQLKDRPSHWGMQCVYHLTVVVRRRPISLASTIFHWLVKLPLGLRWESVLGSGIVGNRTESQGKIVWVINLYPNSKGLLGRTLPCSFTLHTKENTLKQPIHTGLYRWVGVLLFFLNEIAIYLCFILRQGSVWQFFHAETIGGNGSIFLL